MISKVHIKFYFAFALVLIGYQSFSQSDIRGQVLDVNQEPLIGVSVAIKGTAVGTTTDIDGKYSLNAEKQSEIVFTYIGYKTRTIKVNNQTIIDIILEEDQTVLDEVVVVGYGVQKKSDLTGSVSQINAKDVENIPTSRVDQIMQGRAAGVQITSSDGSPGSAPTIRIRGGNSIQGNNEPLWVIDGIIVGQDFNLNNINSNDIKSIEILKDATAISIYGTRGANGVVLVTTKEGKSNSGGAPQVTLNMSFGVQNVKRPVELLNGREMAEYANEDAKFRQASIPFQDLTNIPNTDWFNEVSNTSPTIQNYGVSLSGATPNNKTTYYVSGNYFNQEGAIKNSGIQKYIFRTNFDFAINDKLKTGIRLNISRINLANNLVNISDIFREYLPVRSVYDENGDYTAENPVSASIQPNPVADITHKINHTNSTNFLGSLYLEYSPIKALVLRSTVSPELNSYKQNIFNPGILPQNAVIQAGGDAGIVSGITNGILNENTATYTANLGEAHSLNILGGFTLQKQISENFRAGAYNITNDVTAFNNLAFGSNPLRNEVASDYNGFQLVSYLGRINYGLNKKYLFTVVGRLDGSSRFASGNKYGFFPSAAFAWRLIDEPFIQNLNIFDNLKLRASYGKAGSQAIDSYRTLAVLNLSNTTFGGQEVSGVTLGRPANKSLSWETTKQLDIGLEASLLKGRLSFELDYYSKQTEDLLLNVQIPSQTGFNSQLQNLGAVQNRGLEFTVFSNIISKGQFDWNSNLSLSANRGKILNLGGVDYINTVSLEQSGPSGRLITGQTIPSFVGVNYLGTWKSQTEIDASGIASQDVGGPRFEDTNGDGLITEDDYIILGSPQPDFIYGFQNTLTYKDWSLDFFIQGTYGNEIYNGLTTTAFFGRANWSKYKEVANRWSETNPTSNIPRAGAVASESEIKTNSENIEDASHLRLKNVSLSYNLPLSKWNVKSIKNIRVYFSGVNLVLLSKFRLGDPEISAFGRDNLKQGFANGVYPTTKSYNFGLSVNF